MSRSVLFALVFMLAPALAVAQDEDAENGAWGKVKQTMSDTWSGVTGLSLGSVYVGFSGFGLSRADTDILCDYADTSPSQGRFAGGVLNDRVTEHLAEAYIRNAFTQTDTTFTNGLANMTELQLDGFEESEVSGSCDKKSNDAFKFFAGVDLGRYFKVEAAYVDFGELKASVFSDVPEIIAGMDRGFQGLVRPDPDGADGAEEEISYDLASAASAEATVNLEMDAETFAVAGMVRQSFRGFKEDDTLEVFAKLGIHSWEVEVNVTTAVVLGDAGTTYTLTEDGGTGEVTYEGGQTFSGESPFSGSIDGVDLFYGIGAEYRFASGWALRMEWEEYAMKDIEDDLYLSDGADSAGGGFNSIADSAQLLSLSVLYHF